MKILISEIQLKKIVREYIEPHEAYNDVDAVRTICDGKRGVAFISGGNIREYEQIVELVSEYDLGSFKVPNSKHDAYVIFNRDFEDEAKELLHIAKLNGGYLPSSGDINTITRIGQLLDYNPDEISQFIKNQNGIT